MVNEDLQYRQTTTLEGWSDGFDDLVAKGQRNTLDLPAYYDFSEERYRFIQNGTRIQDPDADSTRFSDQDEQFLIEPQAGDTLEFKTAEAPRYIVGSDSDVSWAFQFLSPLVDANDTFTLFIEGAFEVEYDGAGNVTFRSLENNTENTSTTVEPPNGLGSPSRPELTFNWYAVGRAELAIDYTANNEQQSTEPAVITVDDDWLSDAPVGRVGYRLDVANAGIQLEAGSMAYIPQTDTPPTGRPKPHLFSASELNPIPADGFGVLGAIRIDPERDNVYTTVSEVSVTANTAVDTELWLLAVSSAETDADFLDVDGDGTDEGPAYPRNNSPQNSVIQWTPTVSQTAGVGYPTRTYPVDGSTIPTGRNVGAAQELSAGTGAGTAKASREFTKKRPIYSDDVVLMMGHTPNASTATEVDVFLATDQDW